MRWSSETSFLLAAPTHLTHEQVAVDLPPMGTALPLLIPQQHGTAARPLPSVGDWVKLKVVGVQLHEGQLALVTGSCSRIAPAIQDQHSETAWATRLANGDTAVFATPPLTRCQHPAHQALPLSTVRQVLMHRWEGVGATFRMLARLTRCATWGGLRSCSRWGRKGAARTTHSGAQPHAPHHKHARAPPPCPKQSCASRSSLLLPPRRRCVVLRR